MGVVADKDFQLSEQLSLVGFASLQGSSLRKSVKSGLSDQQVNVPSSNRISGQAMVSIPTSIGIAWDSGKIILCVVLT